MLLGKVSCLKNPQIAYCVNYGNVLGCCCPRNTLFVNVSVTFSLWCRMGKMFCEHRFALHCQQGIWKV